MVYLWARYFKLYWSEIGYLEMEGGKGKEE